MMGNGQKPIEDKTINLDSAKAIIHYGSDGATTPDQSISEQLATRFFSEIVSRCQKETTPRTHSPARSFLAR